MESREKNRGIGIALELGIIIVMMAVLVFYAVIPNMSDLKYLKS